MEYHQEKIWNRVWQRGDLTEAAVDAGRKIYNWFFRRVLKKYLSPDTKMLELGCGTSLLFISLAGGVKKIVGLDISAAAIELSQKNARISGVENGEFILGDCRSIPYEDEFDFVWSNGLLEHFDDPLEIARQHYKAVCRGGVALLSVPYRYSYHNVWYILTRPRILRPFWFWPGVEQIFFTRRNLKEIGSKITPHSRVFFLKPFLLGMVFLELRK